VTTFDGIEAWAYEYCDNAEFRAIESGDWISESA